MAIAFAMLRIVPINFSKCSPTVRSVTAARSLTAASVVRVFSWLARDSRTDEMANQIATIASVMAAAFAPNDIMSRLLMQRPCRTDVYGIMRLLRWHLRSSFVAYPTNLRRYFGDVRAEPTRGGGARLSPASRNQFFPAPPLSLFSAARRGEGGSRRELLYAVQTNPGATASTGRGARMQLPQTAAWVPLRNSENPIPPGRKWLGPVDPNEPIMITIRVRHGVGTGSGSPDAME